MAIESSGCEYVYISDDMGGGVVVWVALGGVVVWVWVWGCAVVSSH